MNRSLLRASLMAALLVGAACADRETAPSVAAPQAPANGRTVFLGLSNLTPKAGEEIVMSLNTVANGPRVGSYKVRINLAAAGLRFVDALPQNDGMVIANPVGDTLIVVGASGDGFTAASLASLRVKVVEPAKLGELALEIDGLTTTDFVNQSAATTVERRLFRVNTLQK